MAKAKDPVCKMEVDENKAAGQSEHKGHKYFFCSKVCKQKFDRDPIATPRTRGLDRSALPSGR
jgi:YHS domain-containing protein